MFELGCMYGQLLSNYLFLISQRDLMFCDGVANWSYQSKLCYLLRPKGKNLRFTLVSHSKTDFVSCLKTKDRKSVV